MKLFILGYMASGKTTFGKALAEKLNVPFIDLDEYIEGRTNEQIKDIFQKEGEKGFREIEKAMLEKAISEDDNLVIACGGGTPCHFDNMELMNSQGVTIFLETSTPRLVARLQEANEKRPLVAGKSDEEIEKQVLTQLCERLPKYMEAKLKWHGDDLENAQEIENNVSSFISSYPSIFR